MLAVAFQDSVLIIVLSFALSQVGQRSVMSVFWAIPPIFLGGTAAAAGIALINSVGNLGGFVGPTVMGWLRGSTQSYSSGLLVLAGALVARGRARDDAPPPGPPSGRSLKSHRPPNSHRSPKVRTLRRNCRRSEKCGRLPPHRSCTSARSAEAADRMSIARETSSLFSSVARERGRDVFHHRAINIVRGDAWAMTASTLGSTEYLIDLVRNNANHITARCTCHEFAGRELCRHIWAALLLAEKKDLLTGPGGRPAQGDPERRLQLDRHPADRRWTATGTRTRRRRAGRRSGRMTWREQLALLRGQTEGSTIVSAAYRPTSRQILYVFDIDASRSGQGVILQIGWQDRRTTGDWGRVQIRPYLSHELAGALDTSDVAVITLLEGAASSYIREIADGHAARRAAQHLSSDAGHARSALAAPDRHGPRDDPPAGADAGAARHHARRARRRRAVGIVPRRARDAVDRRRIARRCA